MGLWYEKQGHWLWCDPNEKRNYIFVMERHGEFDVWLLGSKPRFVDSADTLEDAKWLGEQTLLNQGLALERVRTFVFQEVRA